MFVMENKRDISKCKKLFMTFLKIGAFTFGGGYAMIPLIRREIVEEQKWLSEEDILDIIAISESTPGPIAINSATFVGYEVAGVLGSTLATLGVVLPAFLIILVISFFLRAFESLNVVKYAFKGISIGVLALIINAFYSMAKQCPRNILAYIIAILAFIMVAILGVNVISVLILCAVIGLSTSIIIKARR